MRQSNKRAFTLIEILLSVVILVVIFVYLYGSFNISLQTTQKVQQIATQIQKRDKITTLIYNDYINKLQEPVSTTKDKYDTLDITTANSLHGMYSVNVKYMVVEYQNSKYLVRCEYNGQYFSIKDEKKYHIDIIAKDVELFKINTNNKLEFLIKAKDIKDIYMSLRKIK